MKSHDVFRFIKRRNIISDKLIHFCGFYSKLSWSIRQVFFINSVVIDAILLIIGIVYGACRIVIWPRSDVNKHGFRGKHMHFALLIIPIFLSFSVFMFSPHDEHQSSDPRPVRLCSVLMMSTSPPTQDQ
jgi:hypothetical protein